MEKVYKDSGYGYKDVAVLVSAGYGAGWSSWGMPDKALFDPIIVDFVENDKVNTKEFEEYMEKEYEEAYIGGAGGLYVRWVPEGKEFIIDEYDGAESLTLKDNFTWLKA
jgi:hypothetical protein